MFTVTLDSITRTFVDLMNTPLVPPEPPRDVPLTDFPSGSSNPSSPRFSIASSDSARSNGSVAERLSGYGRNYAGRRERGQSKWTSDTSELEQEPGTYLRESTEVEVMPAYSIQNGQDA